MNMNTRKDSDVDKALNFPVAFSFVKICESLLDELHRKVSTSTHGVVIISIGTGAWGRKSHT